MRRQAVCCSTLLVTSFVVACGNQPKMGFVDGGDGDLDGGGLGPDAAVCMTQLCGDPVVCCDSGTECIENTCLPACDTGIRCGADLTTCCAAGDVCLAAVCVTPGAACADSYDCDAGFFCEPTLGQCVPQPDPLTCEFQPVFDTLNVTTEWSYTVDQIISIPLVANLDGVGAPEVVINVTHQPDGASGDRFMDGAIMILDGASGAVVLPPVAHAPPTSYGAHGRTTAAVGDVDGDALPDIVYAARPSGGQSLLVAIDRTGALLWTSRAPGGAAYSFSGANGAVTLANFDGDAMAEVVYGGTLLDHDGLVVWDAGTAGSGAVFGSPSSYTGGIAVVADLDGDNVPEIITGRDAWKVVWNVGPPVTATVTNYWTYTGVAAGNDGYPAIADLDADGSPEVVLVANGRVHVLDGQTGVLWCGADPTEALCPTPAERTQAFNIPGGGRGGPPTIADFDADGRPEIGVAGANSYSLYDLNRPAEDLTGVIGTPAAGAIFTKWSQTTQDASSNATGSSVFDFQGDGEAEVVYADECYVRVYSGTDGAVQFEAFNTTGTIHEYPLVVDVDGDNNSEILVVANDQNDNCADPVPQNRGLYVFGDVNDEWVPTRRVWTQHAYHVTNATSAGNCPLDEDDNWTQPGLNNYRQNVQGDGIFNAPDLAVELSVGLELCNTGQLNLKARVTNLGALGVPPGVLVEFYAGTSTTGAPIATRTTAVPLLPGASTTVSAPVPLGTGAFAVRVDGDVDEVSECLEDNNSDSTTDASCGVIIE